MEPRSGSGELPEARRRRREGAPLVQGEGGEWRARVLLGASPSWDNDDRFKPSSSTHNTLFAKSAAPDALSWRWRQAR